MTGRLGLISLLLKVQAFHADLPEDDKRIGHPAEAGWPSIERIQKSSLNPLALRRRWTTVEYVVNQVVQVDDVNRYARKGFLAVNVAFVYTRRWRTRGVAE